MPATELHLTTWGEGEPVLLIHGSLTYGDPADDDWPQQRPLAESYQLLMPARRGYGDSPDRPTGYGAAQESDELAALLGEGAHLVGFSYGGFLSLLVAAKRPEAVRSLTLTDADRKALAWQLGRRGIEATMREQPQWEVEIPLDSVAASSFPKQIFSGGWSPLFDYLCDTLATRLSTDSATITGTGHGVQMTGEPFNTRLRAFLSGASPERLSHGD
jgi:pimeloyl-ACP methyl ester carboxylesterase